MQVNTITPVEPRTEETEAIDLMKLLGNRVRRRLLQELGRSDRRVQELASLLARPQNLVSYHLGLLRAGHVISEHRGYTDGRDVYYSLDLDHLQLMIDRAVGAIHPVLPAVPATPRADSSQIAMPEGSVRVLFVSPEQPDWPGIAAILTNELSHGILRALSHGAVDAFSAAQERSTMRPPALKALRKFGVIVGSTKVKAITDYRGTAMDYVVTFSEPSQTFLRMIDGSPEILYWGAPHFDSETPPTADEWRALTLQMACRVRQLLALIGTDRSARKGESRLSRPT